MHRNASDFNCNTCTHKHCDEKAELPGSQGPAPFNKWKVSGLASGPMEFRTCLLPMITEQSRLFMRLHSHYKHNVLMNPGKGPLEQPNAYSEAMELLDQLDA